MIFETRKRKNDDDKPKGLPRHRLLSVGVLLLVGFAGVMASLMMRARLVPSGPMGHLFYTSGSTSHVLDFATGERTMTDTSSIPAIPRVEVVSPDGQLMPSWNVAPTHQEQVNVDPVLTIYNQRRQESLQLSVPGQFSSGEPYFTWSPDGEWLYFTAYPPNIDQYNYAASDLWRVNIITREFEQLTDNTFAEMWPAVSPDGTQLAYVATPDGYRRLYVMDLATREVRLLTPDMFVYWPIWSPDGGWLAFATDRTGTFDVWIVRSDGSEFQPIAITGDHESDPYWQP